MEDVTTTFPLSFLLVKFSGIPALYQQFSFSFCFFFVTAKVQTTKQVFKVRLQKKSSVDLNDPAVTERILKKVNHVF